MSEIRAYAEAHGLSYSGAYKRLHPESAKQYARRDNARPTRVVAKREASRRAVKRCPSCGESMGASSRYNDPALCLKCARRQQRQERLERGVRIQAMWLEGLTLAQIGERLGWSANHVSVEIHWLRRNGFGLPRRRMS